MPTQTVVKKDTIPTVKGHFLANGSVVGSTAARHTVTGAARKVSINLSQSQPNTDRRRYVTHK